MGIATAIGLGASAIGGVLSSKSKNKAADKAADATTQAAQIAADAQRKNFVDTTRLNQGTAQAGNAATARMLQLMGLPVPDSLTSGAAYDSIYGSGGGAGGSGGGFDAKSYFDANPDVANAYNGLGGKDREYLEDQGYDATPAGFAQYHWDTYGQVEGRNPGGVNRLAGGGSAAGGGAGAGGANAIDVPELGAGGVSELIKSTPGYQFRFSEGINAVDSSAANRGTLMSGSQMRRLQEFGDDYAAREFGNYWNRLAGVAGGGQTATSGITATGSNTANNLSSIAQNEGQGLASSYQSKTSTAGNTLGMIGSGISEYYG